MTEIPRAEQLESTQNFSYDNHIQSTNGEDDVFKPPSPIHRTMKTGETVYDKSNSNTMDSIDLNDLDGLAYCLHGQCLDEDPYAVTTNTDSAFHSFLL
uniref:Uncharacterized protein n=1 Tax=Schistosoma haematobium TaxID=6185 RepID=A0A095A4X3_SCHHA